MPAATPCFHVGAEYLDSGPYAFSAGVLSTPAPDASALEVIECLCLLTLVGHLVKKPTFSLLASPKSKVSSDILLQHREAWPVFPLHLALLQMVLGVAPAACSGESVT